MEDFKVENFTLANAGRDFPRFRTVDPAEASQLREKILEILSIPSHLEPSEIARRIRLAQQCIPDVCAEHEKFRLDDTLRRIGIKPADKIFVNWKWFDQVDELEYNDFVDAFGDLWYPRLDDIDIFDRSLQWLASIDYLGKLYAARFAT